MRELWGQKAYRTLFLAGLLSELGTFVSEIAISMRIFELSGQQKQYLGITQGLFLLLMILGTLAGGVYGERSPKTKIQILIGCELARVPILIAMLWFNTSLWTLIIGNGLVAFFSGAFNPTRQALINALLPAALVSQANRIFSASFALLHALGPLLGGVLYGLLHDISPIFIFDLFTYAIGIGLLTRLFFLKFSPAVPPKDETETFWTELSAGFQLLRDSAPFFWLITRCILASAALGIMIPLILPFIAETLSLPDYGYGLLMGSFGIGGVLGGLFIQKLLPHISVEKTVRTFLLLEAIALLLWTFIHTPLAAFLLAFIYGGFLFARIAGQLNFISLRLPASLNARANSMVDLAMVVPNFMGAAVVSILGARFSAHALLQGSAVIFFFFSLGFNLLEIKKARC